MITTLIRRVVPVVGIIVLMGAAVRQQRLPVPGGDTYFHLRFGEEFRGGWSVTSPGHLSPFDTADWIPTQWLAQVGMSWLEQAWGLQGILWLTGTLIIALVVVLYRTCRDVSAPLPAALAVALAYIAAAPGLSPRPQLISFVFIAIVTHAWLRTARDGRLRWWLVPIAWVWPMLHGMWPVGILIGAAAVIGMALDHAQPRRRLLHLASIPAASALVALLSPVGWHVYASLFDVGARSGYFAEWAAPDLLSSDSAALLLMLGLTVVSAMFVQRLTWVEALLLGQAVVWALYTLRTGYSAAVMLAPLVAHALQAFTPRGEPMTRREWAAIGSGAVAASAVLLALSGSKAAGPVVPSWLDARLDALPAQTRVLNEWDSGAWFLWRHPDLDLVMHGYGDVFTDEEIRRNVAITQLRPEWDTEVEELDVDYALQSQGTQLAYELTEHLGWTVVEEDDEFVLLQPPTG